jgi:hypothetical protein
MSLPSIFGGKHGKGKGAPTDVRGGPSSDEEAGGSGQKAAKIAFGGDDGQLGGRGMHERAAEARAVESGAESHSDAPLANVAFSAHARAGGGADAWGGGGKQAGGGSQPSGGGGKQAGGGRADAWGGSGGDAWGGSSEQAGDGGVRAVAGGLFARLAASGVKVAPLDLAKAQA